MAAWSLYVLLVSLLLGLAALAFEQSALLRKKGTRWVWGVSIIVSLAVPFVISSITVQIPSLTRHPLPAGGAPAMALAVRPRDCRAALAAGFPAGGTGTGDRP